MTLFSVPEFPQKELLLHNKVDKLIGNQQLWWDAMVRLSDILSLTMQNDIDRVTGQYHSMLFSEFLEKLYGVVHQHRACNNEFVFDEFVGVARYSVEALKHIVSLPSTQIVKNSEKVHVSQLRQTGSKTMQWMAKRPGRSALEKIAPENKVLSSVTHFSVDTKENRETIYLYNILYDIIRDRVTASGCMLCEHAEECGVPTKAIRDLMAIHTKIRHSELSDVRGEKQTMQNNKLMCDKYYKMIWDAVKRLSRLEDKLEADWNNLLNRYSQLGYWIVLASIIHETDTMIYDFYGTLTDNNGFLSFSPTNTDDNALNACFIYPATRPWEPLSVSLDGNMFSLVDEAKGEVIGCYDLSNVFSMLNDAEE